MIRVNLHAFCSFIVIFFLCKVEMKLKKQEGIRWSSLEEDNESQYRNMKPVEKSKSLFSRLPPSHYLLTQIQQWKHHNNA